MYQLVDDQDNACDNGKIEIEYLHFGLYIRMIDWR